jgi:hypothetical protein
MSTKWTQSDQSEALAAGWLVADIDTSGVLGIQRYDEAEQFESDSEALVYVTTRAAQPNGDIERKALAHIYANSVKTNRRVVLHQPRKLSATERTMLAALIEAQRFLRSLADAGSANDIIGEHLEDIEDSVSAAIRKARA